MNQGIATIGCYHICPAYDGDSPHIGGSVFQGSPNLFIEGKCACRAGDLIQCNSRSLDMAMGGSSSVFINGRPASRLGDPTAHGGSITEGSLSVFIGS